MARAQRLPTMTALTRGTPLSKAIIWRILRNNWKAVRDMNVMQVSKLTNIKSNTGFRLVLTAVTLNAPERRTRPPTLAISAVAELLVLQNFRISWRYKSGLQSGGSHVCSGGSCYVQEKFSGRVQMYVWRLLFCKVTKKSPENWAPIVVVRVGGLYLGIRRHCTVRSAVEAWWKSIRKKEIPNHHSFCGGDTVIGFPISPKLWRSLMDWRPWIYGWQGRSQTNGYVRYNWHQSKSDQTRTLFVPVTLTLTSTKSVRIILRGVKPRLPPTPMRNTK